MADDAGVDSELLRYVDKEVQKRMKDSSGSSSGSGINLHPLVNQMIQDGNMATKRSRKHIKESTSNSKHTSSVGPTRSKDTFLSSTACVTSTPTRQMKNKNADKKQSESKSYIIMVNQTKSTNTKDTLHSTGLDSEIVRSRGNEVKGPTEQRAGSSDGNRVDLTSKVNKEDVKITSKRPKKNNEKNLHETESKQRTKKEDSKTITSMNFKVESNDAKTDVVPVKSASQHKDNENIVSKHSAVSVKAITTPSKLHETAIKKHVYGTIQDEGVDSELFRYLENKVNKHIEKNSESSGSTSADLSMLGKEYRKMLKDANIDISQPRKQFKDTSELVNNNMQHKEIRLGVKTTSKGKKCKKYRNGLDSYDVDGGSELLRYVDELVTKKSDPNSSESNVDLSMLKHECKLLMVKAGGATEVNSNSDIIKDTVNSKQNTNNEEPNKDNNNE